MSHLFWTIEIRSPRRIYLVEGIYDAWRLGYNAVASFSKTLTREQRQLILRDAYIDELIVCWDEDAYEASLATARDMAALLPRVGLTRLPTGEDPDSYGAANVRSLPITWM